MLCDILSICALASAAAATTGDHSSRGQKADVVKRDVCIIGGGSSGTYSAVRLQQMNKTVAVVERNNRLGGHVNTYVNPATNQTFDYGVIFWKNTTVVTDYFAYLDVPLARSPLVSPAIPAYADFANASRVSADALATGNLTAGFEAYLAQLAKYPYLTTGFDLPDPVPEDLLLPFGDFVRKYDLGAIAFTISLYNQGMGNILAQPTLYVLKYFPASTAISAFTDSFVTTARHNNQELYDKALEKLGSSVFLDSNVIRIKRYHDCVEVLTSTPTGPQIIHASALLVTVPPELASVGFLDTDGVEQSLLGQFNSSYYWDTILEGSGIPDNVSLTNIDPQAPYGVPAMPGIYIFGYVGMPGLHTVYYSSPHPLSDAAVKADILAQAAALVQSLGYKPPVNGSPTFVGLNAHNPFELTVSTEAIRKGFYGRFGGLQGRRRTWWTGAAWQAQDSSAIWDFTERVVLPQLVAAC